MRLTNPGDLSVDFSINAATNDFHIDTNVVSNVFVIDGPTGNVGIRTLSPGKTFEVNGSLKATDYFSGDGTQGISTTIQVEHGHTGDCYMLTFKDGLLTDKAGPQACLI